MAAERKLPELRSRLRLDTSDLPRAERDVKRFASSLSSLRIGNLDTKSLDDFKRKTDEIGASWTRNVTLPVVAAGGAAAKLALDFNTAFNQMQTLAGVTADEVDGLKESVKDLAVETGRSPDELAQALYFIRSSGFEGAEALDVLRESAQGARIGLGSAAAVADAVTSGIQNYGSENLTAAQAVDALSAAVAEGKGEASEFAPQLGRLLPIANALGVGFSDVAGGLAFLTKGSGDTALAATQLNGILTALLRPTEQGRKELEGMGLSANALRESVESNGLLATLTVLSDKLGGNKDQLGRLFEDQQALQGFLGLTQNADDAAASIDKVTNSAGFLDDAVSKVAGTDGDRLNQDLASLKVTAIDVGEELLPLLADVADNVAAVIGFFTSLPEPVQTGILALAGFAAAVGPVSKGLSGLAGGAKFLDKLAGSKALDGLRLGLMGVDTAGAGAAAKVGGFISQAGLLGPAGVAGAAAIALIAQAYFDMAAEAERAKQNIDKLSEGATDPASIAKNFNNQLANTLAGAKGGFDLEISGEDFRAYLKAASIDAADLGKGLLGTGDDYAALVDKVKGSGLYYADTLVSQLDKLRDAGLSAQERQAALADVQRTLGIETDATAGSTSDLASAQLDLGGEVSSTTDEMQTQVDAARSLFDAHQAETAAGDRLAEALVGLADARREQNGESEAMRSALDGVAAAEEGVRDAQASSAEAQAELSQARVDGAAKLEELRRAAAAAVVTEAEAQVSLDEARRKLQEGNFDSDIDRRKAEIAAQRAEVTLAQATADRQTAQQDAAQRVDQLDEVQSAIDRVTEAAQGEQDARERLGEASDQVAKVQTEASARVEEAEKKVVEAQLDHIDAQADLAGLTDGATGSTSLLVEQLSNLADSLDPANPLRANLLGYIADLESLQELFAGPQGTATTGPGSLPAGAAPGLANAERSLGGARVISPSLPDVSVPAGPRRAGGDGGRSVTVPVSLTINGGLTDVQVAEVKEMVSAGVSDGITKAAFP